jgi:hypothetical protein
MNTPAVYLGTQSGFKNQPPVELYNLLAKVGRHPVGSTVSRKTLEDHGLIPPEATNPPPVRKTGVKKRSSTGCKFP